jgi:hypothetical protein
MQIRKINLILSSVLLLLCSCKDNYKTTNIYYRYNNDTDFPVSIDVFNKQDIEKILEVNLNYSESKLYRGEPDYNGQFIPSYFGNTNADSVFININDSLNFYFTEDLSADPDSNLLNIGSYNVVDSVGDGIIYEYSFSQLFE